VKYVGKMLPIFDNLNKDHKIEKIDFYVKLHTKCKIHPKFPINIFCLDEKSKNY
jgi:hypothetical protein